jgi:hypothetical protein
VLTVLINADGHTSNVRLRLVPLTPATCWMLTWLSRIYWTRRACCSGIGGPPIQQPFLENENAKFKLKWPFSRRVNAVCLAQELDR